MTPQPYKYNRDGTLSVAWKRWAKKNGINVWSNCARAWQMMKKEEIKG